MERKFEATEMRCHRRMLHISRADSVTNEEVLTSMETVLKERIREGVAEYLDMKSRESGKP